MQGCNLCVKRFCWTCGHFAFGCFVTGAYNNTVQVDDTDYGYDDGKNEEWLKDDMSNL